MHYTLFGNEFYNRIKQEIILLVDFYLKCEQKCVLCVYKNQKEWNFLNEWP